MDTERRSKEFEAILQQELKLIQQKPGKKEKKCNNLVGISMSGGGIRAGYFGLGVIQALVESNRLKEIDYMSTVSGGGYTGSSLTWFLHLHKEKKEHPLFNDAHSFNTQFNNNLNFIRQHASPFLAGTSWMSAIALLLRVSFLGILVYLPLLSLAIYLSQQWNLWEFYRNGTIAIGSIFALTSIGYSFITFFRRTKQSSKKITDFDYRVRTLFLHFQGWLATLAVILCLMWSIHPLATWLLKLGITGIAASASTLSGYICIIWQRLRQYLINITIGSVLFIYGLLLFAYILSTLHPPILWGAATFSLFLGYFVNINLVGLHRIYRDRLMEIFLPDPSEIHKDQWGLALKADTTPLSSMCGTGTEGPYHIYSCTVNLFNSRDPKFGGRGADSFVLSPLFCGSTATGWQKTKTYMDDSMNAPTAMAISGAILNPRSGRILYQKIMRLPMLGFLMTLFNIRLGYWAPNPMHTRGFKPRPNYFHPGFLDLVSAGHKETSSLIELSDGGHFENLGLYELVRRRVKVLIVCDGSGFSGTPTGDLGTAIERVRVDFGVDIAFNNPDYGLQWVTNGSDSQGIFQENYGLAKRGFAIGSVSYPEDAGKPSGIILYIRANVTEGLPPDVYAYKNYFPDFPTESTYDQFYIEEHFEVYRAVGYHHAMNLMSHVDDQFNLIS